MHASGRKLLRTFSPSEQHNLSTMLFSMCVLLRSLSQWFKACTLFLRRRLQGAATDNLAHIANEDTGGEAMQRAGRRVRAQSIYVKAEYQSIRALGDTRPSTLLIPLLCARWSNLPDNEKAFYDSMADRERDNRRESQRMARGTDEGGAVIPDSDGADIFPGRPWGFGSETDWIRISDIEPDWNRIGKKAVETCDEQLFIDARSDPKLRARRIHLSCQELGCCRAECWEMWNELGVSILYVFDFPKKKRRRPQNKAWL